MMTSEEKRKLWMDEFRRELARWQKLDRGEFYNLEGHSRFASCHANEVVAHASRLMPDFAEPERGFDRQAADEQLRSYLVNYYGTYRDLTIDIIDGKIPGVKYTPPTTTNPG